MKTFLRNAIHIPMYASVFFVLIAGILVFADVIMRYIMNNPIQYLFELVSYFLLLIIFYGALGYGYIANIHIEIDLIERRFPRKLRIAVSYFRHMCVLVTAIIAGFSIFPVLMHSLSRDSRILGALNWPVWLFQAIAFAGWGALAAAAIYRLYSGTGKENYNAGGH